MKKPELLAPAGEYAGLVGAVAAGADAVYLGGDRFGARAYARNFTTEELVRGLSFAHLHGRRIYLTLNTLIKEREFGELESFIGPLDDAGLDGIIVQDQGVLAFIRERFPRIRLHASTQMAVTGVYSARYLKSRGVSRVVPARELSLRELEMIRRGTDDGDGGMEIEAFIHGAMCYSYSGMCLFSSMIGGRSGNRGRCAGPCRLPYTSADGGGKALSGHSADYPLSLRDMCTYPVLAEILRPGEDGEPVISSLKIEGRMKDPVYTAGVTAVYRKALDAIFDDPETPWQPDEEDLAVLKGLYLRTDLCDGYYFRHNSGEMISGKTPGYIGSDRETEERVRARFLAESPRIPVRVHLSAHEGKPLVLSLETVRPGDAQHDAAFGDGAGSDCRVELTGVVAAHAEKREATRESLTEQLDRFGTSDFEPVELSVDLAGAVFVPASALNELRRNACAALADRLRNTDGGPR
ncbi:MAG: U32 family peptidase [Lachnospiraceae bacterium]|nr:U32 family peptidase [Lachnospiraceae bacterium]